jgi:NitT/TauT family transport system substrate-binding protein
MTLMTDMRGYSFSRRSFLANTSALGAAWLLGAPHTAAAEPSPETTRIRLTATPAICLAPQYVAEALLKAEGFTDIQYVKLENPTPNLAVASGQADISMDAVWGFMARLDAGEPITLLSGVHRGCYELFGTERVRSI